VLRIRLTRTGKAGQPSFRIVVAEHSKPVKGKFIEVLGYYLPIRNPKEFKFNQDRISYWISKGAKPSDTLATLLKQHGMEGMDGFITYRTDLKAKKKKSSNEETPIPVTPAPALVTEEKPSESATPVTEEKPTEESTAEPAA